MKQYIAKSWALNTIVSKAIYDIKKSTNPDLGRLDEYIRDNAFLATAQLRNNVTSFHIVEAQSHFHKGFGTYHATVLRKQCLSKVTNRSKKYQPIAFMAFDIESSRHNGFSTFTSYPHGHGVFLFHEGTLGNFRDANERFLNLEGGYEIRNPTPYMSLVTLKPVNSLDDLTRFMEYSLKLEGKLRDNNTNYEPYNFYPGSSVYFPFWGSPDGLMAASSHASICERVSL